MAVVVVEEVAVVVTIEMRIEKAESNHFTLTRSWSRQGVQLCAHNGNLANTFMIDIFLSHIHQRLSFHCSLPSPLFV